MKDPSFRYCPVCAKRTVHRKHKQTRAQGGGYAWICAECHPKKERGVH